MVTLKWPPRARSLARISRNRAESDTPHSFLSDRFFTSRNRNPNWSTGGVTRALSTPPNFSLLIALHLSLQASVSIHVSNSGINFTSPPSSSYFNSNGTYISIRGHSPLSPYSKILYIPVIKSLCSSSSVSNLSPFPSPSNPMILWNNQLILLFLNSFTWMSSYLSFVTPLMKHITQGSTLMLSFSTSHGTFSTNTLRNLVGKYLGANF